MIEKAKSKRDNLSSLWTFGCRFYVQPPGKRKSNLKNHASKTIFIVYNLHATLNVLYYYFDTHRIKLASHVWFDEGMNDLPMVDTPLNVQHICIVDRVQFFLKK